MNQIDRKNVLSMLAAAGIVLLIGAGGQFIGRNSGPPQVVMPARPLSDLPHTIGTWEGTDTELLVRPDTDLATADTVNRDYRDGLGQSLHLHAAAFQEYGFGPSHPPEACYRGAGYKILKQEIRQLQLDDGRAVPVGYMICEKGGVQFQLLYWYHLAGEVFVTREGQRDIFWSLMGKRTWPAQIKVLLHMPVIDPERTEMLLQEFAESVYAFTKTLSVVGDA